MSYLVYEEHPSLSGTGGVLDVFLALYALTQQEVHFTPPDRTRLSSVEVGEQMQTNH